MTAQDAFEAEWKPFAVHSLHCSWESVIKALPLRIRQNLRRPIIEINGEMCSWGRWQSAPKRLLELRQDLLLKHPWYAVMDVLRHEIAHQVLDECFPEIHESPHGPKFCEICKLLGGNPAASGNYPLLDQRYLQEEEQLTGSAAKLAKIRKLLALSGSANPHEAEVALLKVRELSEKYELPVEGETDQEAEFISVPVGKSNFRRTIVDLMLGDLLQSFYQVIVLWCPFPDFKTLKYPQVLMVSGTIPNVKIASYAYDFILRQIEESWQDLVASQPNVPRRRTAKRDYTIGFLEGLEKALKNQPVIPEAQAIILQKRSALELFFRRQNPSIRTTVTKGIRIDPRYTHAGERAGRNVTIPRGIERTSPMHRQLS